MTASARTTCQSFSTSPSPVARAPATRSTRRRSSTLKAHECPVIADAATHPLGDSNGPACRDLGGLSGLIGVLQPRRRGRDAETVERFRREDAQPLHWGRRAIEGRRRRLGIEPMADLHQLSGADQPTQDTAHLIIAAQIVEVVAQKYVPPCAGEALDDTVFQIFRLHRLSHPWVSQYDIISHISTGNSALSATARPCILVCI